jgi:hypothetical protein
MTRWDLNERSPHVLDSAAAGIPSFQPPALGDQRSARSRERERPVSWRRIKDRTSSTIVQGGGRCQRGSTGRRFQRPRDLIEEDRVGGLHWDEEGWTRSPQTRAPGILQEAGLNRPSWGSSSARSRLDRAGRTRSLVAGREPRSQHKNQILISRSADSTASGHGRGSAGPRAPVAAEVATDRARAPPSGPWRRPGHGIDDALP